MSPSGPGSRTPWPRRSRAAARSCCWRARPASARRAWPRRSRRRRTRSSCAARRAPGRRLRAGGGRAARVPAAAPGGLRSAARCAGTSPCCCPSSATPVADERPRDAVRGDPLRAGDDRRGAPGGHPPRRPAVVRRRDARAARVARRSAARPADARGRRLPLRRGPARAPAAAAAQRPAPRPAAARAGARAADAAGDGRAGRARPRAARPPALAGTLHDRTGGVPFFVEELAAALEARRPPAAGPAASTSRATATCRCPRRSATPCCCAPPTCPTRPARRPRPRPWPAPASTSSSWPRSAATPASTSCSPAA